MKNQKGYSVLELIVVIVATFCIFGWIQGVYKFASCDFESPYKAEVVHGAGIVLGTGAITGWMDLGK